MHVEAEANATQAVGKAHSVDSLVDLLKHIDMDELDLTYTVGEESALWKEVFSQVQAE